jgi:hypothetical protein
VTSVRQLYVPPTGDEPLDEIEQALVRALVSAIVKELRAGQQEAAAERQAQRDREAKAS